MVEDELITKFADYLSDSYLTLMEYPNDQNLQFIKHIEQKTLGQLAKLIGLNKKKLVQETWVQVNIKYKKKFNENIPCTVYCR